MGALYASVGDVVGALDLPELARLNADVQAGAQQLSCDRPVDVAPGALLLVGYKGQSGETATVQNVSADGVTITLTTPLTLGHPQGTLLLNVTPFPDVAEAASRLSRVRYAV
ncbi:hypothetical protein GCM10025857_06830 [Alicyclobacillus contaminans]|uniref:hypothetical protein n=1 Tax=Alicyclobacillus contaminans TaxID=392016 RepID=UPI00047DAC1B|nr:hypothetical protein [Alicyclobacillus contaminans]GMA49326.1 hypothetical protein GCM10025857_06830 [Alicyclobacillus contaminans]